jgi:carbamoyltransferase
MYILGLSAFYHDSAVALIKDGIVIWAAEEERFSRIKHDNNFPFLAIQACFRENNIEITEIDFIAYYEKPLLKFERILENFVLTYPKSLKMFIDKIPEWLNQKIKVESIIRSRLRFKKKIFFIPHHVSHGAASYYSSKFDQAAILTIDGVGEYETTQLASGNENKINVIKSMNFPNSLGLLYSTFTSFLGFRVNEDEYKLMGLSAYGKPEYYLQIKQLIDLKDDGSFRLDMKYFAYESSSTMWSNKFEKIFGKPKQINEPFNTRHKNIAASIQKVTEEIYLLILNHLHQVTKLANLCIGGGVALNALANGKIFENTPFKKVYILGASGDSGAAIGAGLFVYHHIFNYHPNSGLKSLQLGTNYHNYLLDKSLFSSKYQIKLYQNQKNLIRDVAKLLKQQQVIGWFQGAMEFGPRALGSRSILASPRDSKMKDKVNQVKKRELYRPFAGAILEDELKDYFHIPTSQSDFPFMNFCFQVKTDRKEQISAIIHQDNSSRIQTVNKTSGLFYDLIEAFYQLSGIPCLLNTSFNIKGEPLVESPEQAINDFKKSAMDCLVINNYLIKKLRTIK